MKIIELTSREVSVVESILGNFKMENESLIENALSLENRDNINPYAIHGLKNAIAIVDVILEKLGKE